MFFFVYTYRSLEGETVCIGLIINLNRNLTPCAYMYNHDNHSHNDNNIIINSINVVVCTGFSELMIIMRCVK